MNRTRLTVLALAVAGLALPALTAAQDYRDPRPNAYPQYDDRYDDRRDGRYDDRYDDRYDNGRGEAPRYDTARVMRVEPFDGRGGGYQRQECWDERANRYDNDYYRDDDGRLYRGDKSSNVPGAVVGAVVGGAIGNQVGDGNGQTAATVAGAVIGAVIGSKVGSDGTHDRYRDGDGIVRRCRNTSDTHRYGGMQGYRVTYRYANQTYQANMRNRPGRNLPVVVHVQPRENGVAYRD